MDTVTLEQNAVAVQVRHKEDTVSELYTVLSSSLGPLAGLLTWLMPLDLDLNAQSALAIVVFMAAYWIMEPVDHAVTARSLQGLAEVYRDQGRHNEAEPLYRRSLSITAHNLGPNHPDLVSILESYAALLEKVNRSNETKRINDLVQAIKHTNAGRRAHADR